jgi:hypothetical protein
LAWLAALDVEVGRSSSNGRLKKMWVTTRVGNLRYVIVITSAHTKLSRFAETSWMAPVGRDIAHHNHRRLASSLRGVRHPQARAWLTRG